MGEGEKKIGLILFPVAAPQKFCPSVVKNPGVVACGDPADPPQLRLPHKKSETHLPVTESARVGSKPFPVRRKGWLHDQSFEIILGLDDFMGDAQFLCCQGCGVDGAAGVLVGLFGSPKPKCDTLDLVTGFFKKISGHGGVHSP